MSKDPILAGPLEYNDNGDTFRITVRGGLHFIKGNGKPYFSITADISRKSANGAFYWDAGGCCHEKIAKRFPGRFDDLIALHLSDIDGAPMHDAENAWYWAGGCGQSRTTEIGLLKYQLKNLLSRSGHGDKLEEVYKLLGVEDPALDEVWERWDKTPNAGHLASQLRIPVEQAQAMADDVCCGNFTKADMTAFVDAQRARWKEEAEACIAKHGLVVYGDPWPVE